MTETGPPYPPTNEPGSNAIGGYVIGVSPIGILPPFDPWTTIISQYANAPTLTDLVLRWGDCVDQTRNLSKFFDLMVNIETAQGYGLDVWARIVGINRVLSISAGPPYFGFDEGYPDYEGWNQAPYYSGQPLTQNYLMADPGFRVLILAKAFSNICDGSAKAINRLLRMLFGQNGKCYVRDNNNMTMTYVFEFALQPVQVAILTQSGVFPKPTGVSYNIQHLG